MDGNIKATGTPLRICEIPTAELVAELFCRYDYGVFYGKILGSPGGAGPDGYAGNTMRTCIHGGRLWDADEALAAAALIRMQAMKNLERINEGLVGNPEEDDDGDETQETVR